MFGFWWDKYHRQLHLPQNIFMTMFLLLIELICELIRLILLPIKFIGFKVHIFVFIADGLLFIYNHFYRQINFAWLYLIAIYVGFVLCILLLKFIRKKISKLAGRVAYMLSSPLFRTIFIKPTLIERVIYKIKKKKEVKNYDERSICTK